MTEQVGRVLGGRYRLVAPIGAGASSQVFLADDTRLRRRVAVKVLHDALAEDSMFLRRFESEAQLAAALNHPHIMAVYDWGHDDVPYLVTEYLAGGSLRAMLDRGQRLTPSQALVVGLEATRALDHAHRRGLVHRDITPANLLFDDDGRLRIADFGLARALAEASVTEPTGAFLGTARYASPEQAQGQPVDARSDVYSLALVLTEAVTGSLPFDTDTAVGTLMARVDRPLEVSDELGPLRPAIERAGAPDPADRPDADQLAVSFMATAEALPRPDPLRLAGATPPASAAGAPSDATELPSAPGPEAATVAPPADQPRPRPRRIERRERRLELERQRAERHEAIARGEIKRRRWPWVLVTLALLAGAAAGGWFAWQAAETPTHVVPNVVGADIDELGALVGDFGWEIVQLDGRQDGSGAGEIIAQSPDAGVELEEGAELEVTVSLGNSLVDVPIDLIGLPLDAASLRLEAQGLTTGAIETRFDEVVLADVVLEVDELRPQVARGEAIDLVVSAGPAPRIVPDGLVGINVGRARRLLEETRLVSAETRAFDDDLRRGLVISVSPESGTEVPADSTVTLVVSDGPEPVVIPDVEGLGVLEATEILEEAGLVVDSVDGSPTTEVLTTDPPAGETVERGTGVRVVTREIDDG